MKFSLLRQLLLAMTILSLLGQGVFANGYAMATNEMMLGAQSGTETNTEFVSSQSVSHQAMANHTMPTSLELADKDRQGSECHTMMSAKNVTSMLSANCCDGPHQCDSDCNHCLSIAMAANLFSANIKMPKIAPQTSLGFVRHDFTSQAPAPAFRPPII